jgi:arginyl-tRNA synthetase
LCVFPAGFVGREGEAQPLIVRKQDGGYGYVATDLAAIRHRLHTLGADHVLYVVGTPQSQHFAMVFTTAREAGWVPAGRTLEHIAFGSVLGEDKKPIKSRAGESISLLALLEESVERARAVVDQKSPHLPEEQRAAIARAVGIGAVKYADLSNDRVKDYVFAWDRLLSFDGNTAPYLMYAHARTRSILAKAGWTAESTAPISLTDPAERALALELVQFPSVVQRTGESRQIHRLCQYLYDLATTFTTFFERCPVLKSEEPVRSSRLALCVLTARVLAQGLDLLGIEAPRVM